MKDRVLTDWLNDLGSKSPTPGGGAVAGLNGAVAAAQLKMICEYTKDNLLGEPDLENKVQAFLELSEHDSQAYLMIKEAYKSNDNIKIQQALLNATEPSNQIAVNCQAIYGFCEDNLAVFNKNLLPDLVVALANLAAATESAQSMLLTNAKSMDEGNSKSQTQEKISFCGNLISKINVLKDKVKLEIA